MCAKSMTAIVLLVISVWMVSPVAKSGGLINVINKDGSITQCVMINSNTCEVI